MTFFCTLLLWFIVPNLWLVFGFWLCRADRNEAPETDFRAIYPPDSSPVNPQHLADLASDEDLEVAALCCHGASRDLSVVQEVRGIAMRHPAHFPPQTGSVGVTQNEQSL